MKSPFLNDNSRQCYDILSRISGSRKRFKVLWECRVSFLVLKMCVGRKLRRLSICLFYASFIVTSIGRQDVVYAAEKWILWHGVENLGYVLVLKVNEHNLAPIDVVAAKLKLEVKSNENLWLKGKIPLNWCLCCGGWDGHNIISPLSQHKDGHWWLETNTTLKLLTPRRRQDLKWAGKTEATQMILRQRCSCSETSKKDKQLSVLCG